MLLSDKSEKGGDFTFDLGLQGLQYMKTRSNECCNQIIASSGKINLLPFLFLVIFKVKIGKFILKCIHN